MENCFKQCIEISSFILDKNKELVQDNQRMQKQAESFQINKLNAALTSQHESDLIREKDAIIAGLKEEKEDLINDLAQIEEELAEMQNLRLTERQTLI